MATTTYNNITLGVEIFRDRWIEFIKRALNARVVEPVGMVNRGYLHTLNASFDGLFLREQESDSLLIANHQMSFGTIQPCIRTEDKLSVKHSVLHLGLFEICGSSMLDFPQLSAKQMAEKTIAEFMVFYTDYLKLDRRLLRVYYFGGGTLRAITKGRIKSDHYIEPDDFSVDIWKRLGVSEKQLVPDFTNETFLLHLGNPLREHHSGYRNDIFIELNDGDFEIATLNFISHQTVVQQKEVIGIKPLPFYLREIAIGQERFLAAAAGMKNLYHLPHIYPLFKATLRTIDDEIEAMIFIDALRVVHYLFSDGWTPNRLRGRKYEEHRHEINKFMDIITSLRRPLTKIDLVDALELNADLQPWYPKLKRTIGTVKSEIQAYQSKRQSRTNFESRQL